jgi:hypothetical protein
MCFGGVPGWGEDYALRGIDMNESIFKIDKIQASDAGKKCPKKASHGKLTVTSRMTLICGDKSCNYEEPASIPDKL